MPKAHPSDPGQNLAVESTTRGQILKAAAKIFLANGYERTSMELVAAESRAGRRTVYNHFRSKKVLFDATVAFLWGGMPLNKVISRSEPLSPEHMLAEIGYAIAESWAPEESVAFMRLIISEGPRFPELVQSYHTFGAGPARMAFLDFLRYLNSTKAFDIRDPDNAHMQFIQLINGSLLWKRLIGGYEIPSRKQRRYVVDEAVETFLSRYKVNREK